MRAGKKRGTIVDDLYEDLRARIISLEFPPGHQLNRQELALEYEVSLTPLRDAFQRLEAAGLLDVRPQSRTMITKIDVKQVTETAFLRAAIESEIVARCAADPERYRLDSAEAIHQQLIGAIDKRDDFEVFARLDKEFHAALYTALDLDGLYDLVDNRSGQLDRIRRVHLRDRSERKPETVIADHATILAAITAGDPVAARQAMQHHLSGTLSRLGLLRERYPKWF
jgi:DNA-binding GntR family transcriptional regulator